jgi:hypothetical protein
MKSKITQEVSNHRHDSPAKAICDEADHQWVVFSTALADRISTSTKEIEK